MSRAKRGFALFAGIAIFLLLAVALLPSLGPGVSSPTTPSWIGENLWVERALDLAIQAFILLAGVFVVVLLLREPPRGASS